MAMGIINVELTIKEAQTLVGAIRLASRVESRRHNHATMARVRGKLVQALDTYEKGEARAQTGSVF